MAEQVCTKLVSASPSSPTPLVLFDLAVLVHLNFLEFLFRVSPFSMAGLAGRRNLDPAYNRIVAIGNFHNYGLGLGYALRLSAP